jgi:hypothetical protein
MWNEPMQTPVYHLRGRKRNRIVSETAVDPGVGDVLLDIARFALRPTGLTAIAIRSGQPKDPAAAFGAAGDRQANTKMHITLDGRA